MAAAGGNHFLPFGASLEEESSFELKGELQPVVYVNNRYLPLSNEQMQIFKNLLDSKRLDIKQCLSTVLKCRVQITYDNKFICCVSSLEEINGTWNNCVKSRDHINTCITKLVKSFSEGFHLLNIPEQQFYMFVALNPKSYDDGVSMFSRKESEKIESQKGVTKTSNVETVQGSVATVGESASTPGKDQQQQSPDASTEQTSNDLKAQKRAAKRKREKENKKRRKLEAPNTASETNQPDDDTDTESDTNDDNITIASQDGKEERQLETEKQNVSSETERNLPDDNHSNTAKNVPSPKDHAGEKRPLDQPESVPSPKKHAGEKPHLDQPESVSSPKDHAGEKPHLDQAESVTSNKDHAGEKRPLDQAESVPSLKDHAGEKRLLDQAESVPSPKKHAGEKCHLDQPKSVQRVVFQLVVPKRFKPSNVYILLQFDDTSQKNSVLQKLQPVDSIVGLWQLEIELCNDVVCQYRYRVDVIGTWLHRTRKFDEETNRVLARHYTMDVFRDKSAKKYVKYHDIHLGCWDYIKVESYGVTANNLDEKLDKLIKNEKIKGLQYENRCDKKSELIQDIAETLKKSRNLQKFFLLYIVGITFDPKILVQFSRDKYLWNDCLNCFDTITCYPSEGVWLDKFFLALYRQATGAAMSQYAAVKHFYRCLSQEQFEHLLASCVPSKNGPTHMEVGECCKIIIDDMKRHEKKAYSVLINVIKNMQNLDHVLEVTKTIMHVTDISEDARNAIHQNGLECAINLSRKQIKNIDAINNMAFLTIWRFLEKISDLQLQQNVLKIAQKKVMDILQNKSKWTQGEGECFLKIINDCFVFKEDCDVAVPLGYIAKYIDAVGGKLFLEVIGTLQCISQPLEQCCLKWLDNAIDHIKRVEKTKEKRIRSIFEKLESILNKECIYANKELARNLEKLVEAETIKYDLEIVLNAGCNDELQKGKCNALYINTVIKKIESMDTSDTSKLLAMVFPAQSIVIDYEHMAMLINTILTEDIANTYNDHSEKATDVSAMKYIFDKATLWIQILKVSGKFAEEIKCNQTLRNVREILKIFFDNIKTQMVTAEFVTEIVPYLKITEQNHYRTDVLKLFEQTLTVTKGIAEVFRTAERHISELHSRVLRLSKVCSWVEAFDRKVCTTKILSICDMKQVQEDVDCIIKMEKCNSVTDTEQLIERFQLCSIKDLTRLVKSMSLHSFKNFTHSFIEKENLSQTGCDMDDMDTRKVWMNDDQDHEIISITFDTFLHMLVKDVLPKYIELLKSISSSSKFTVSTIMDYFDDIGLQEEICKLKELPGIELHHTVDNIFRYIHDENMFKEKGECLSRLCDVFGSGLSKDTSSMAEIVKRMLQISKNSTMSELYSCFSSLEKVTENIHQQMWEIISELSRCQVLVEFLQKVKGEDLRNLIDAVEEHSEQFVDESTISHLIKIKSLLYRILSKTGYCSLEDIINDIQECFVGDMKGVPQMINDCSSNANNIKFLYLNVENRGEVTKSVVVKLLKDGIVTFTIDEETVTTEVAHTRKKRYGLVDLADLKSRVLLIGNTEKHDGSHKKHADLQEFVTFTNLLGDINVLLKDLQLLGHFDFQAYKQENKPANTKDRIQGLSNLLEVLKTTKLEWVKALNETRLEYYYLNYLHSTQLHVIYDYFCSGKNAEDTLSILKFINPKLSGLPVRSERVEFKKSDSFKIQLEKLAKAIHLALGDFQSNEHPPFCENLNIDEIQNIKAKVTPGKVYVAHIDVNSLQAIPVLLAMYVNNTRAYPLANEVLFCNEQTSLEEVELLINRCADISRDEALYCITGVEELDHEKQLHLVQYLNALERDNHHFMLAVLCKADAHDFFISSMSSRIHRAVSLNNDVVEMCLRSLCPQVYMITSNIAGQGKTENVHKIAEKNETIAKTVSINGPLTKPKLINKIRSMNIMKSHTLHLDIGVNNQAGLLDNFIFELAVLHCVTTGTKCVHLNTEYIAIEVANTLDDSLRNSLEIASCFKRVENLSWNIKDLIVSKEPHSAVQVVCRYLQALDTGEIFKQNVSLESKALTGELCCSLLVKYLGQQESMSFTILHVFLEVLANQLRRFTASQYFRIASLKVMLENEDAEREVRIDMVKTMIEISKEFTFRSVKTPEDACNIRSIVSGTNTSLMLSRVEGMIKWSDSNHLLVLFHGEQTLSVLYRKLSQVPNHVKKLFKTQKKELPDYEKSSQDSLLSLIRKMSNSNDNKFIEKLGILHHSYALTPDNILKMMLIILRVRTGIPVLIMGETGCGKTTLIKYLAAAYGVLLDVFQFHAGITEDVIMNTVLQANQKTKVDKAERWLFLDEINTCNHLGLINEIICSKTCGGEKLDRNLIILSACNPYIKRENTQMYTTGLKEKLRTDEFSCLVYRVHPLPESMLDYVWDYGQITKSDELAYIGKMVVDFVPSDMFKQAVKVLSFSQSFIRDKESSTSVSLRDIHRARVLMPWFERFLELKKSNTQYHRIGKMRRAILLSLSLCYGVRLSNSQHRNEYWAQVSKILNIASKTYVLGVIHEEQMDILNRMILPDGIAKNSALKENVFVLFVCIYSKMPVFIVGKPGCSKSLSMQLLRSNLRGADSDDKFFRKFPQLFVVSYQGSESSTSDGIIKVFEKAEKYKKHNEGENVLPVVLIDEVGLAEESHSNPLKVLHSLLEPAPGELPQVAVVGISNWALDPAKMNRAVHLSRPDLTVDELVDTAEAIRSGLKTNLQKGNRVLQPLAEAYYEFQRHQTIANFHGLRDYYALIKYVCLHIPRSDEALQLNDRIIHKGILRNFNGRSSSKCSLLDFVFRHSDAKTVEKDVFISTEELIQENVSDKASRHLMVVTNGNYSLGIITSLVEQTGKGFEVIIGSKFTEDHNEGYSYRILNRIILCMEQGLVLILKDLESIYGSLYDMLNQNYTTVGMKKNCRIALGAHSNPMCIVHDDFRCLVLIDSDKVNFADPPFLNRFEKQVISFRDLLIDEGKHCISEVQQWLENFSSVEGKPFSIKDAFLGYQEDSVPSLIHMLHRMNPKLSWSDIVSLVKKKLLLTSPPDAILRVSVSRMADSDITNIENIQDEYFKIIPSHGLQQYILDTCSGAFENRKIVVLTRSLVSSDLHGISLPECDFQLEILATFKSEKHISHQLESFFNSKKNLLIIQCKPSVDCGNMVLLKFLIENYRNCFIQTQGQNVVKHVMIMINVNRVDKEYQGWQFDYTNDWQIVTLDNLEEPQFCMKKDILGKSPYDLIQAGFISVKRVIAKNLNLCFSHLRFTDGKGSAKRSLKTLNAIHNCSQLLNLIEEIIISDISKKSSDNMCSKYNKDNWQVQLATSTEQIWQDSTFNELLKSYLVELIKDVLVTILWILEETSCWASFVVLQTSVERGLQNIWQCVFQRYKTMYLHNICDKGLLEISSLPLQLLFPFSLGLMKELEEVMVIFLQNEGVEEIESLKDIEESDRLFLIEKYKVMVEQRYMEYVGNLELCEEWADLLIEDIHNIQSYHPDIDLSEPYRKLLCTNYMQSKITGCVRECCPFTRVALVLLTWSLQKAKIRKLLQLVLICDNKTHEQILEKLYDINQTEEQGDFPLSCDDYIVQAICSQLTATMVNVERLGGIDSWFSETNRMLAYASKVAFDPPELHFLRFCIDMYMFLVRQYHLDADILISFCNSCESSPEEPDGSLDSGKGFTYIAALINTLHHDENVSKMILQRITCMLFARCIDSNSVSPRLEDITNAMYDQSFPEPLLTFCGPVVHRIILNLDIEFKGFCSVKIAENNVLDNILGRIKIAHSHPLVALTVDITEKSFLGVAKGEDNFQDFEAASQIISSSKQTSWSLHYLLAVGYCHIYLQWFVSSLHNSQFQPSISLNQRINSELKKFTNSGDICGLLLYMTRLLHKGSVKDLLVELTSIEKDLSCIQTIEWPKEEILLGIGFNAMCLNDGYSEAKKMITDGRILDLVKELGTQFNKFQGVVAAFAEKYFWIRMLRTLSDTEKLQKKVLQKVKKLPEYVNLVINGIIGQKSFRHKSLNLTMQSTYNEALQASILLHLLTFLTQQLVSGTKSGLWFDVVKTHGCVGLLKEIESTDMVSSEKGNDVQVINCSCGNISLNMLKIMETKPKCPICKSEDVVRDTESLAYKQNKEAVLRDIVSLFIGGCSLAKYVLHLTADSEKADQSYTEFLQLWKELQITLDVSEKEMTLFLHAVLNKSTGLRSINEFVALLKDSVMNVKEESSEFKNKLMGKLNVVDEVSAILEYSYSNKETLYNPIISRLIKVPSMIGLRSCIKLTNECKKDYNFLEIVTEKEKELELLNSLPTLVKWCRVVHKSTHHKITRRDAEVQTLHEFVMDTQGKNLQKELFEKFKSHWEKLRKSETLMMLMNGIELPKLSNKSFLSECIIQNKEHPLYAVMKVLCIIQNDFLKKASALALENYNAVCFLLKDDIVSLPCHPLYQTDLSNVVEFKWDDDFLLHSQNSTQYGKGSIVEYDLLLIEKELADTLLFGKSFIVMDERFPVTIYFKEIFNRNSHILNDIKEQVKQQKLPYHIQQRFKDINRKYGYTVCKRLLNHLELILFFLHECKQKTSSYVKSFQQKWGISDDQLDHHIYQNLEEVELCHIVELYELIEQDIAGVHLESLVNEFNKELDQAITDKVHEFTQKTSLESLLKVVGCFVVRYMSQSEEVLDPQDSLVSHLNECREIIPDTVSDKQEWLKQFPAAVLLCHVKHLHNHLSKENENASLETVISKPALKTFPSRKKKRFLKT